MSSFSCEGILNFITPEQKKLLNARFSEPDAHVMTHEISGPLSISYDQAISILTALQLFGLTKNYILVYHNCEPDLAVSYVKFEEGLPSIPWLCPNCQEEVESLQELSFGMMAISNQTIQFV